MSGRFFNGPIIEIGANVRRTRRPASVAAGLLSCSLLLLAVSASGAEKPGKEMQLAPVNTFALPVEVEADSGAANGDATIIRLLPLYNIGLNKDWRLVNLDTITLADAPGGVPGSPGNPNATPGSRAFGLSDLLHTSLLTPEKQRDFIWGAGLMLGIPTATDEVLGSGKWTIGPALRLTYRSGPWNIGGLAGNLRSFAGDADRADVNQLVLRGAIRRDLPENWYFVSAPIITANWKVTGNERWLVPVGGGLGKLFRLGRLPWASSVQGYYNLVRPDAAPEWSVRWSIIAPVPLNSDESSPAR